MTTLLQESQVPFWRKIVAGILGIAGSVTLVIEAGHNAGRVIIPIVALVVAAIVIHRPTLGPQLLARAIWWSNLGLGAILCFVGGSSERNAGLVLLWGCGLALLVISRKGLAEASERATYAPAAFRGSLLLLMVLALADAQSFLLFGIIEWAHNHDAPGVVCALAGVGFLVGFIGLYRIKVWGAITNVITAVFIAVASRIASLRPSHEIDTIVLILAVVQIVAAAPMLITVLTQKKVLPSAPARLRGVLANAVVVLVMLGSTLMFLDRAHF